MNFMKGSPSPQSTEAQKVRDRKDKSMQKAIKRQQDEKFRALLKKEQESR